MNIFRREIDRKTLEAALLRHANISLEDLCALANMRMQLARSARSIKYERRQRFVVIVSDSPYASDEEHIYDSASGAERALKKLRAQRPHVVLRLGILNEERPVFEWRKE